MNQVCWSLLSALKWRFSPFKGHTEKKLNTLQARDNLLLRSVFDQAKGKIGYMEKPESGIRSRKRKRNPNPNPNLRNKTWRLFCLKSVTNNYCLIKTFHPHIIFIYCYYIFYCRIFCVRPYGAKFLFENFIYPWVLQLGIMIDMSTPPPFAAFSSQWMKHGALLRNE